MMIESLTLKLVESMPETKQEGILYYSKEFELAIHLCACGCKEEAVTPIREGEWSLTITNDIPTMSPSIGNFNPPPYHAHYWIKDGKIIDA